jgi:hypothetical protein
MAEAVPLRILCAQFHREAEAEFAGGLQIHAGDVPKERYQYCIVA